MSEVTNLPVKAPELKSGGAIRAIVPQSMDEAYRLAKAVCLSGLAPRGLDKPEAAMVAIMHGLEIGLTPMMALQKIAVINGRPTLWGDGALGLVRGSGLCKYVKEWTTGTGDAAIAHCETLRYGEPEPITRTFSVADAKKAGLWGKQGPWQNFPARMLSMRARAFALRDGFADVLGGMYLAEELQGTEADRPTPEAPTPPRAPPPTVEAQAHILAAVRTKPPRGAPRGSSPPSAPPTAEPVVEDDPDWSEFFAAKQDDLASAKDATETQAVMDSVDDAIAAARDGARISASQADALRSKWDEMSA